MLRSLSLQVPEGISQVPEGISQALKSVSKDQTYSQYNTQLILIYSPLLRIL